MSDLTDQILENYKNVKRDSLIPILQDVQEALGFLSEEAIVKVGKHLNLPTSKIYGLATFYDQFRFEPQGKFHFKVCRGTACHIIGSLSILEFLEKSLKIRAGQKSPDGFFSIEVVPCMGACSLGPVISVNNEFFTRVTSGSLKEIVETYRQKEE
jgi:NADH:ubiquinone oxidoreductase subunit E